MNSRLEVSPSELTVRGLTKSYGSLRALDDVDASFAAGEINALLGENGAGKSTMMNLLCGFATPDRGEVSLNGTALPLGDAEACRALGVAMIHQHFTLAPGLTVRENLLLASLHGFGPIQEARQLAPFQKRADELGWRLDLDAMAGLLPVGAQQRIEILKALGGDSKVVVFDEPTAVLSQDEVDDLFKVLRRLRDSGVIVVLIAHKLQEVLEIADRVTVLRRGKMVASAPRDQIDGPKLAQWMVGEMPEEIQRKTDLEVRSGLELENVSAKGERGELALDGLALSIGRGEILGIGGVDGNGQVELAEVLAGVRKFTGNWRWDGKMQWPTAAYIPQDRQADGLAMSMSIADNLLIGGVRNPSLRRGPFIKLGAARRWADQLIARFGIVASSSRSKVAELSGGNQQKVVVARALDSSPELLVAVNPTRGLDVRAADFVHRRILEAQAGGAAVALISTDLDELAALSSRIIYLSRGKFVDGPGAVALVGGVG